MRLSTVIVFVLVAALTAPITPWWLSLSLAASTAWLQRTIVYEWRNWPS